jgi:chromosomal replication initiation ATPase DnaA
MKTRHTANRIIRQVLEHTGITLLQMQSPCREERLVFARKIIVYCAYKRGYDTRTIAQMVNRNRATIHNIISTHDDEYKYNPKYRRVFDEITGLYNEGITC